jgi:hypothetical protein
MYLILLGLNIISTDIKLKIGLYQELSLYEIGLSQLKETYIDVQVDQSTDFLVSLAESISNINVSVNIKRETHYLVHDATFRDFMLFVRGFLPEG